MKIISTTKIKLKDVEEGKYTEENYMFNNPHCMSLVYNVEYYEGYSGKKASFISDQKNITPKINSRIIIFRYDDGVEVWENMKVHKLRKRFRKQFLDEKIPYICGFILGTCAPFGPVRGMSSANNKAGYIFWQRVAIVHDKTI